MVKYDQTYRRPGHTDKMCKRAVDINNGHKCLATCAGASKALTTHIDSGIYVPVCVALGAISRVVAEAPTCIFDKRCSQDAIPRL